VCKSGTDWIQRYKPERIFIRSKEISEYIVDETLLKVGPKYMVMDCN
jgi:putative transposase